jgi:hypothetical protein
MKIFRQLIETESNGSFLADASHDGKKIHFIKVFPIDSGIVGKDFNYTMEDLTNLTASMQKHLTESLKE